MSERIKIKYWWSADRKWFCVIADDGNAKATVSLTPEEAGVLSMHAVPSGENAARGSFAPEDLAFLREKGFVETADEIERLQRNLNSRDAFLGKIGQWDAFVAQLPR